MITTRYTTDTDLPLSLAEKQFDIHQRSIAFFYELRFHPNTAIRTAIFDPGDPVVHEPTWIPD
jgi:hypothetical protein